MAVTSIQDWNDFLNSVGENFYDLVHGEDENSTQFTRVDYYNALQYRGAYCCQWQNDINYVVACIGDFSLNYGQEIIFKSDTICSSSNVNSYRVNNGNVDTTALNYQITAPRSYIANNQNYWIGSDSLVYMKDASNVLRSSVFTTIQSMSEGISGSSFYNESYGRQIKLNSGHCTLLRNSNGYDYYFSGSYNPPTFTESGQLTCPLIIDDYPIIFNSNWFSNRTVINNIKNSYVNNGDTITTYTYNIDTDNYITVNYSTDIDDVPTGYIDILPTGQISFDDLFDMFNTILAPLVGVGLDLPDWNDYLPPAVTGDVNVNIDFPNVTGEYPIETIAPLSSEFFVDTLPALPALTMDNVLANQTAGAVGAGFTFFDGLGLLSPFITLAIVRLLVSKFRGDS